MPTSDRSQPPAWLLATLGGAVGSGLRYLLDVLWVGNGGLATLAVNLLGSFALGYLIAGVFPRPTLPRWVAPTFGPGLIGGFTTMSGVAAWVTAYYIAQNTVAVTAFLLANVLLGLLAAWSGVELGQRKLRADGLWVESKLPEVEGPDEA